MEILAIIPARGGSKGLPKKNTRILNKHPLLAYSILAAQQSKLITRIITDSDSEEIISVAKKYNCETPFIRPAEFSGDTSTDMEVFSHALKWLKQNEKYVPDFVIQLRPTSPVRPKGLIDACIRKLLETDADSLRVVTQSAITPYKMWNLSADKKYLVPLLKIENVDEPYNLPRQKLPLVYWQAGTADVIRTKTITKKKSMSGEKIIPYIIENKFALDIDDVHTFFRAEEIIKHEDVIKFNE